MVHTPSADGVGENVTAAAVALLAGEPAALPVQLPCRVRLTLLAEDDTLNFRIEALARFHNDEASFASARTSADAAQQSVSVYSQPLPPTWRSSGVAGQVPTGAPRVCQRRRGGC